MLKHDVIFFFSSLVRLSLMIMVLASIPVVTIADEGDEEELDKAAAAQKKIDELKKSTPLLKAPETPKEYLDAVDLMVDFARPELARVYLDELMASSPDEATLLQLRDEHGPAIFLKLARVKELQPASKKLLKQMNTAFRKSGADPKRIDKLIAKLGGSSSERNVALNGLESAGAVVIPRMLQRFSTASDDQTRNQLIQAIISMGKDAVPPLVAAAKSGEKEIQAVSIEALGMIGDRSALDHLWYPAFAQKGNVEVKQTARKAINRILHIPNEDVKTPEPTELAKELKRIAMVYYQNRHQWRTVAQAEDDPIAYWSWDQAQDLVVVDYVTEELASKRMGLSFAREAFYLLPENKELQSLYIGMALALDAAGDKEKNGNLSIGKGTALNAALSAGEEAVSKTLSQSLKYKRPDIALAALQVLSQIGTRSQLSMPLEKQSPIVAALNYPEKRVQYAAATTILQLDPQKPFRGSTRVVSILTRTLRSQGLPAAIVIHPNTQISVSIASLVSQLGFQEATIAPTGREGFTLAANRDDVEIIFVDANVAHWGLSQTISNLRADARTAYIPIVIFGPFKLKTKILKTYGNVPLLAYIDKPTRFDQLERQMKPFLTQLKSPTPTPEQRAARIESAAYWLAHIANGNRTAIFNIQSSQEVLIDALNDPRLFDNSMQALSVIPSQKVQQQFQKIAINTDQKKSARQSAILQLAYHIQRFSQLLDDKEISELKIAQKNSSEDAELSTAFATLIGSLKPDKTRIGNRLKLLSP